MGLQLQSSGKIFQITTAELPTTATRFHRSLSTLRPQIPPISPNNSSTKPLISILLFPVSNTSLFCRYSPTSPPQPFSSTTVSVPPNPKPNQKKPTAIPLLRPYQQRPPRITGGSPPTMPVPHSSTSSSVATAAATAKKKPPTDGTTRAAASRSKSTAAVPKPKRR
ncbi:extensin-like [Coffea eugenioides]|uniref:extensin-like n=1 Tax=Coffea eugenioides TaxID=49369 RepID=UPI000F5C8106|nr:extensin-like [Coffea arabica]XP_027171672.1 extensin-like [Coffea eugenioides]